MEERIQFLNMFSQYQPSEPLLSALSQAAITAADIDPASRRIEVTVYADQSIPLRLINQAAEDICAIYGLLSFHMEAQHPADQLQSVEIAGENPAHFFIVEKSFG